MTEFGNQIDIEYEIWCEREYKDPKKRFAQVHVEDYGYGLIPDLDEALALCADAEEASSDRVYYFVVEVVSVRTEYGAGAEEA